MRLYDMAAVTGGVAAVDIVIQLIALAPAALMLYGLQKERSGFLLPYLIIQVHQHHFLIPSPNRTDRNCEDLVFVTVGVDA